jgi:hypothetical protein
MNFQSGKFCAPPLGKLFAFSCEHVWAREIGEGVNLQRDKLSELKIQRVSAFPIGNLELRASGLLRRQVGNWSRSKFSALKIETVENGSIRQ